MLILYQRFTLLFREDIEEISDEEAEWSDDFEPINFSASQGTASDLEEEDKMLGNPVVIFDIANPPPVTALKYWTPPGVLPSGVVTKCDQRTIGPDTNEPTRTMNPAPSRQNRTPSKPRDGVGGGGGESDIEEECGEDKHETNGVALDPIEAKVQKVSDIFRQALCVIKL